MLGICARNTSIIQSVIVSVRYCAILQTNSTCSVALLDTTAFCLFSKKDVDIRLKLYLVIGCQMRDCVDTNTVKKSPLRWNFWKICFYFEHNWMFITTLILCTDTVCLQIKMFQIMMEMIEHFFEVWYCSWLLHRYFLRGLVSCRKKLDALLGTCSHCKTRWSFCALVLALLWSKSFTTKQGDYWNNNRWKHRRKELRQQNLWDKPVFSHGLDEALKRTWRKHLLDLYPFIPLGFVLSERTLQMN